jgi:hypothetical protein
MSALRPAALGFRPHTGWTAMVALAGPAAKPSVVARRRVEFTADPYVRFLYHAAAEGKPEDAEASIARAHKEVFAAAKREVAGTLKELRDQGCNPIAAALPDPRQAPGPLASILAVHAKLHAAEGWFYRAAVAEGCKAAGLSSVLVDERKLWGEGAAAFRTDEDALKARVKALGDGLGPPWAEDQRLCALMAWLALRKP